MSRNKDRAPGIQSILVTLKAFHEKLLLQKVKSMIRHEEDYLCMKR